MLPKLKILTNLSTSWCQRDELITSTKMYVLTNNKTQLQILAEILFFLTRLIPNQIPSTQTNLCIHFNSEIISKTFVLNI